MFTMHARRSWRAAWLLAAAIAAAGLLAACNNSNPSTSASGVPEPAAPPTPNGPLTASPSPQTPDANMPQPAPMPANQPGYPGGQPAYTVAPPTYGQPGYAGAPPTYGTPGYAPPAYAGGGPAYGAPPGYGDGAPPQVVQVVDQGPQLSDQQLDDLLAPVALYPDPLIAEMLPAATYPDELASAGQWLSYNPAAPDYAIDAQPWDTPIKALAHSPSVLVWMNNNPDWTRTLGAAFTYQPQDVMNSIQRLRGEAQAAGALVNTPQQIVVVQDRTICIEPAVTNVIYVPVYDWHVVYVHRDRRPVINFYVGCNVGVWLSNDCDWDDATITIGAHWDRGWDHRWDGDRNARATHVTVNNTTVNNTTVNNTTVNNTRVVQVGGTAWKRDAAKPLPVLPPTVTPAKSPGHLPANARDNSVRPTTPQGGAARTPVPGGTSVQATPATPNPSARSAGPNPSVRPAIPNPSAQPATLNPSARPAAPNPSGGAAVPNPSARPATPNPSARPATSNPSVQTPNPPGRAVEPRSNVGEPPKFVAPVTPPSDAGRGGTLRIIPATPTQPNERGRGESNSDQPRATPTPAVPDRGADRGRGPETPPVTPPTPAERGADRGRGPEVAPPPATPPADRGSDRGRGPATQGDRGGGRGG